MRWLGKEVGGQGTEHRKNSPELKSLCCSCLWVSAAVNAHPHCALSVFHCLFLPLVVCLRPTSHNSHTPETPLVLSCCHDHFLTPAQCLGAMPKLSPTCMCLSDLYVLCCMYDSVISLSPACFRPF